MEKKNTVRVQEIPVELFIKALAEQLKQKPEFKQPEWSIFVKTGVAKIKPPEEADWWYVRAASIIRTLYIRGIVGVKRLKTKYGSRKNRGKRPEKFVKASGKIIRTILQQATKAELVDHIKDKKTGRKLTKKGKDWLEEIAGKLKQKPKTKIELDKDNNGDDNKTKSD